MVAYMSHTTLSCHEPNSFCVHNFGHDTFMSAMLQQSSSCVRRGLTLCGTVLDLK